MKIGIICLANGPYSIFIDNLIQSCEEKFLINYKKEYFIITDSEFECNIKENVYTISKQRNGWPLDCLLRPQYSYELKEKTKLSSSPETNKTKTTTSKKSPTRKAPSKTSSDKKKPNNSTKK
jgi:hypothetical protein